MSWTEVARRFTPPVDVRNVQGYDADTLERMLYGFTTVEQQHRRTGKLRFAVTPGDQRV